MQVLSFFYPEKDREGLRDSIRRRVPFLVGMDLLLLAYFLVSAFLRTRADPAVYRTFFIAVCATESVFIASLAMIRRRRYVLASYLGSLGILIDILWIGLLIPFKNQGDLYRFGVYLLGAIAANTMVALDRRQVGIYFGASIAVYALFVAGVAAPAAGGLDPETLVIALTLLLLFIAVNVVMLLVSHLNHDLLGVTEEEGAKSRVRAEGLKGLIASCKGALATGRELVTTAQVSMQHSSAIRRHLADLRQNAEELSEKTACADSDNSGALDLVKSARKAVDEQNIVIVDAGAAVERMASTIHDIAALAETKRGTVSEVVSLAERQGADIRAVLAGMERIRATSDRVMEAIGGILDISEKTQLLAMNASIEAAHAGTAGRGFAVIAGEIRKLSQETQESTRRIGEAVKTNDQTIRSQTESIGRFTSGIDRMIGDVKATFDALGTILNGLGGVTQATDGLNEATVSMLRLARETKNSVLGVAGGLESGSVSAAAAKNFACSLAQNLDSMLHDFESVEHAVEKASLVGERNLISVTELDASLASIDSQSN